MMKLGGDGDHGGVFHAAFRLGLIVSVLMGLAEGNYSSSCPEAIFAFGASMTDTGNAQAAFPYASAPQTSLPYGETYFKKPADRYSNGRLVIDFFAQALNFPFLHPYLQPVGGDFRHGANFATSGSMAANNSYPASLTPPFTFYVQSRQFEYFKQQTLALWKNAENGLLKSSLKLLTRPRRFQKGLFFVTTGTNDFLVPLVLLGQTIDQVKANVTGISNAVMAGVEELYNQGARTVMVFNLPPLGCYPVFLASLASSNLSNYDSRGCLATLNEVIQSTNVLIKAGVQALGKKYPGATFIYVDMYTLLDGVLSNPSAYGFKETIKACCGAGGNIYNVQRVLCGTSGYVNGVLVTTTTCADPNSYFSWDGIHTTEAVARIMAESFLKGDHLEPSYALSKLCKLNFEKFNVG